MPRQKLRSKKGSFSIRKNDTTHPSVMVSAAELGEVVGIDRSGKFIGSDIGTKWISRKRDPDPELDNAGGRGLPAIRASARLASPCVKRRSRWPSRQRLNDTRRRSAPV